MTRKRRELDFIALDGEGITYQDGRHEYVLLAASTGEYIESYERGGLSTAAVFAFLLDLADAHPGATFGMFGGSYDWQMWIGDAINVEGPSWPALQRESFIGWKHRPSARHYRFRMLGRHSFYLAQGAYVADHATRNAGAWSIHRSITIWEWLGWFQSNFVDAIELWRAGRPAVRQMIRDMKEGRARFTARQRTAIRRYCLDECTMLADMMADVGATLDELQARPRRWDGAGAGAWALLDAAKIDVLIKRPRTHDVDDAVMRAYVGGRVQAFVAGQLPGATLCYDLASAYPRAMAELPGIASSRPEYVDPDTAPISKLSLCRVAWRIDPKRRLTPLPYRIDDGSIWWPSEGEGWYWGEEVSAARDVFGPDAVRVVEHYKFRLDERNAEPFRWLDALAEQRAAWRADDDPRASVIKLITNAMYGKLVQSRRDDRFTEHPAPPRFQCYIWGGMTTAAIRAQVLRLAARVPDRALVAIMTDAVYSMVPLKMPRGEAARWSGSQIEPGLLVIQAGIMVSPSSRYVRARGVGRASISYRRALAAWRRHGFDASITVAERRFIGSQYAAFTSRPGLWRTWQTIPLELSYAVVPRQWPANAESGKPAGLYELLYPPAVAGEGLSKRYVPRILDPSLETAIDANELEQPDVAIDGGVL